MSNRKKGNAKAVSSDIISAFSNLSFSSFDTNTSVITQDTLGADIKFILAKVQKRDVNSKVKALDELNAYINQSTGDDLSVLIPHWAPIFNKLSGDIDKRVRLASALSLYTLVGKLGKRIAPVLKEIIGCWIAGHFDPHAETTETLLNAFNAAFPDKRAKVMESFQKELLLYVCHSILVQTPEAYCTTYYLPILFK